MGTIGEGVEQLGGNRVDLEPPVLAGDRDGIAQTLRLGRELLVVDGADRHLEGVEGLCLDTAPGAVVVAGGVGDDAMGVDLRVGSFLGLAGDEVREGGDDETTGCDPLDGLAAPDVGDGCMSFGIVARDFARLSSRERTRTLVLDPTREGRQALTDAIRAELLRDGTLGERAMTVPVLESLGLTEAQRGRAASNRLGNIVLFRKYGEDGAPRRNTGYRIEAIVRLIDPEGAPRTWFSGDGSGAEADAFAEIEQELHTGGRIQIARNNYAAQRLAALIEDRDGAQVGAIDETLARQKRATIATPKPVRAVGMAIEV